MIYFDLNEAYLDDNQEFWDYHTKMFDGRNPFDTTKGESPFVKQLLGDPDYMADYKNLTSEIVQMTPREYFEGCAEIFDSSVDAQINQIKDDKIILTKLQKVLNVYRRTFPITYLNYAERGQEGRHRMYVVGEMLGWDKKFPVLVINWYNQELADKEAAKKNEQRKTAILDNIVWAVEYVTNMYCIDVDDFKVELQRALERKFDENEITIKADDEELIVTVQDVTKEFNLFDLNIDELDTELDIEDLL